MHWVEKPGTSLEAMRAGSRSQPAASCARSPASATSARTSAAPRSPTRSSGRTSPSSGSASTRTSTTTPRSIAVQAIVDGYPGLLPRPAHLPARADQGGAHRAWRDDRRAALRPRPGCTSPARAPRSPTSAAAVDGVADLKVEPQVLVPQVDVQLRPSRGPAFGLTPGDVRRAVTTLLKGPRSARSTTSRVSRRRRLGRARACGATRRRWPTCAIDTPAAAQVPLGDVADVRVGAAPNEIKREAASRRIDVTCNVRGRDLGSVAREIERRVGRDPVPAGLPPRVPRRVRGAAGLRDAASSLVGLLSLVGILPCCMPTSRSAPDAAGLPDAPVRAGRRRRSAAAHGRRAVARLAGRVRHRARHRGAQRDHAGQPLPAPGDRGGRAVRPELVLRGAEERLAPILMTALATALALVPLAFSGNKPGHEIEHPLAVVILGGLVDLDGAEPVPHARVVPALCAPSGQTIATGRREMSQHCSRS